MIPSSLVFEVIAQCMCRTVSFCYAWLIHLNVDAHTNRILTASQNADWPRFFSYSPDIWAYLDKVCDTFGLRKYMNFNTEVVGCYWDEEKGEWKVKLRQTKLGGQTREFEDHCHLLLNGTGILNNYKVRRLPAVEHDARNQKANISCIVAAN